MLFVYIWPQYGENVIFSHPDSQYNGDNYEMLIRIIYSILNRSSNMILRYNGNLKKVGGVLVV